MANDPVKRLQVIRDLFRCPTVLVVLMRKHLKRIWVFGEFTRPYRAKESSRIRMVVQPMLLLPTAESGGSLRNLH